jgi:hypothetical protein
VLDWITSIWTKPIGTWVLLDFLGILALLFVGLPVLVYGGIFIGIMVGSLPAVIAKEWRETPRGGKVLMLAMALLIAVAIVSDLLLNG